MGLWMQTEGTKQICIMNFSVLDFFKFASRMPQIAQIKIVLIFQFFRGEGGMSSEQYATLYFWPSSSILSL